MIMIVDDNDADDDGHDHDEDDEDCGCSLPGSTQHWSWLDSTTNKYVAQLVHILFYYDTTFGTVLQYILLY